MGKLFSKTYLALRQEILSGKLVSGESLIEQTLANRFEVSRTPIREAIRQLQQEGLVEADRGGGLRVTVITIADAIHLYDCRLGLEQIAAMGACENATPAQLEDLQDCLAQANLADPIVMEAESSHGSGAAGSHESMGGDTTASNSTASDNSAELENRLHIDQSFHRLLAESSGNPQLADLLEQIFSKMALLRLTTTYQNPDVLEIWAEHERIVDAIVQRDSQAAAIAVRDHLVASKARVVQALEGLRTGLRTEASLQGIALF
ncbi:MAG: GntR family transcriptional regulator [Cyanobacteria bacterium P01_A01_bin.116]